MTATKKLRNLIRTYEDKHGKRPNVILVSPHDEYDLQDELPDPLKSDATVNGIQAVLPRFEGIQIRWGAKETAVDWEEPLPPESPQG